jgi:hypothetical protein
MTGRDWNSFPGGTFTCIFTASQAKESDRWNDPFLRLAWLVKRFPFVRFSSNP